MEETCGCGRPVRYMAMRDGKQVGACSKYGRCLDREEALEALRAANIRLLSLLAVIHRDGGQHTMGVGVEQSMLDAENRLFEWRQAYDERHAVADASIDQMANRFLAWKLPRDFAPDHHIHFDRSNGSLDYARTGWWPTGTNLLNAEQARELSRHLLGMVKG